MQKVKLFFLYTGLILVSSAYKPALTDKSPHWITLDEAMASNLKEKRPILIDLYTDWCGWCKEMDKKTYSSTKVTAYLDSRFYTVRLNAETRNTITWDRKEYKYNPAYRSNEFAVYLTNGKLQFPTTVIIPGDGSGPQSIPGYFAPKDFELIVKYFGENGYGRIPFADYQKHFIPSW
jgi:thioredoxin-related protein